MHRASTTESDHGQRTGVNATVGGLHGGRFCHALIDHVMYAECASLSRDAQILRHFGHRRLGGWAIEQKVSSQKAVLIDVAQQQIGIGHRGLGATTADSRQDQELRRHCAARLPASRVCSWRRCCRHQRQSRSCGWTES